MMHDQFKNLKDGDKITLIAFNDFGFLGMTKTTFQSVTPKPHYQNCPANMYGVELIHKPKGKRTSYRKTIDYNNSVLIYEGWKDIDIDKIQYNYQDNIDPAYAYIRETKYCSFDKRYLKDITQVEKNPLITINI